METLLFFFAVCFIFILVLFLLIFRSKNPKEKSSVKAQKSKKVASESLKNPLSKDVSESSLSPLSEDLQSRPSTAQDFNNLSPPQTPDNAKDEHKTRSEFSTIPLAILSFYIQFKEEYPMLAAVEQSLKEKNIRLSAKEKVFLYTDNSGVTLFSVANITEPGPLGDINNKSQKIPGLSFFSWSVSAHENKNIWSLMVNAGSAILKAHPGRLLDNQGNPCTPEMLHFPNEPKRINPNG